MFLGLTESLVICSIWLRVSPAPSRLQAQIPSHHVGSNNVVLHLLPGEVRAALLNVYSRAD